MRRIGSPIAILVLIKVRVYCTTSTTAHNRTTVVFQFFRLIASTIPGRIPNRICIGIIMGKKSKANRKKAPVATATATATAAVAASAAAEATASTELSPRDRRVEEFPESTFYRKENRFFEKGNISKAKKIYLQGIAKGCARCMFAYTMRILSDGATTREFRTGRDLKDNQHLHLALPLVFEGAIRGNRQAILMICEA